jgi:hypothetical protein
MKRAVKRAALDSPAEGQEPLPFFSEPATPSDIEELAAQRPSPPQAKRATFYDDDGRFVPRCACGAYGSFGVGVSLRQGREGTWWCGPCWRKRGDSGAIP